MYFPLRGKLASGRARYEPVRVSLKHGACVWDDRVHTRPKMYFPLRGKLASGRARHEPVRVSLQAPSTVVQGTVRPPQIHARKCTFRFAENWPADGRGTSPCASRYEHPAQCPGYRALSGTHAILASGRARHEPVRVSLRTPSAMSRVPRALPRFTREI
ncbi:hypothetical protein PLICRDRAFT_659482 [Plicaturopsis crispa FD-325 SS-3]|uniref:Uncharacterized protein n=1 Tax=Plicaturopsis crispa FD-325 SS-3 TaxID=944288 RepID=A0A0C9SPM9_PLICR|nr:hypothetical protein PLICRDRAFT_659482 [Plicaturopsis crispa FD-325 SS-3]